MVNCRRSCSPVAIYSSKGFFVSHGKHMDLEVVHIFDFVAFPDWDLSAHMVFPIARRRRRGTTTKTRDNCL